LTLEDYEMPASYLLHGPVCTVSEVGIQVMVAVCLKLVVY